MAIPTAGAFSFGDINTELGKSPTNSLSLNDVDVRSLAGISSGKISMSDLRGKSVNESTFDPQPGSYDWGEWIERYYDVITSTVPVVWTYKFVTGGDYSTATPVSGGTDTEFNYGTNLSGAGVIQRVVNLTVTATSTTGGTVLGEWTITYWVADGSIA